jgi:hypothetical protein
MDAWDSTPRIAFLSPEPGSGKSRALEVSELLVPNPVQAVNVTPAYLFRKVGEGHPTLLYDEIDTVFGPKARENEEIRGLLNAGHRRGAVAGRCVVKGKSAAYCAVALAGLGGLPDTILSRSVIIKMRRRAPGETIEPFRRRDEEAAGTALRKRVEAWARTIREDMARARPKLPATVTDRDADVWEPLLSVAEAAGSDWPERARVAAVALVALSKESTPSLGLRLLADLRQVFGEADVLATETILTHLHALEESPWADIRGKPLDSRGLANRLREYEIKPKVVRIGDSTPRGYERSAFQDGMGQIPLKIDRKLPIRDRNIRNIRNRPRPIRVEQRLWHYAVWSGREKLWRRTGVGCWFWSRIAADGAQDLRHRRQKAPARPRSAQGRAASKATRG